MKHWKRALALGFLSWLIPFAGGFVAYPLKRVNAGLFDTAMAVILLITAALLARRYFRDVELTAAEAVNSASSGWRSTSCSITRCFHTVRCR